MQTVWTMIRSNKILGPHAVWPWSTLFSILTQTANATRFCVVTFYCDKIIPPNSGFLLPTRWFWSPYKQILRSVAIRWTPSPSFNTLFLCCTCSTDCNLQNHMYCCKPLRSPNKIKQRKLFSKALLWRAWASNSEDRRLECFELAAVRRWCHVCCVVRGLPYLDYGRSFNEVVRSI